MSWHIASLILRCRPDATTELSRLIAADQAYGLRAAAAGRLVVLIEGQDEVQLADRMNGLRELPGVLAVDLVHHEIDDDEVADATVTP